MKSDCSDVIAGVLLRVIQSQSQGYTCTAESLLDADISYHMNTYQINRLLKKKLTLRYVPEALGEERFICVTLG